MNDRRAEPDVPERRAPGKTVALTAALGVMVIGGSLMLRNGIGSTKTGPVNGLDLLDQVRAHIRDDYVENVPEDSVYRLAIDGMLTELDDPYDAYLTPDRTSRLAERTLGNYAGIGLQVDMRDGAVVVVNPVANGPGERAGILTGDRIVRVDGRAVSGYTPEEVQKLLRGAPGSLVAITVEHSGSLEPVTVTLERTRIHTSAVKHATMLAGGIGYTQVAVFSDSTARELASSVDSLVRAGATSLVLDLRGNPGGLLDQGVGVANLFLDKGARVASTRGRSRDEDVVYTDTAAQRWPTLPMAVLVDDKTASAAEVVAGALQDHDRAVVVGLATYGKGSVQHVLPVSTGAVRLTTARWYTPLGRQISRKRVTDEDAQADTTTPSYKTGAGRKVLGGGGIIPDVIAGDTTPRAENYAFMRALGTKVAVFHDVLTAYALELKAHKAVTSPAFSVSPAMTAEIFKRMTARGLSVPRPTYDAASPLVARLFGYEVARYAFGANAELDRKMTDDRTLAVAKRLLTGATNQRSVFDRAADSSKAIAKG